MKHIQPKFLEVFFKEESIDDDCLKAVGYTCKGERKEFKCIDKTLKCNSKRLSILEIPEGIEYVYCMNNFLTTLILPKSLKALYCENNLLNSLNLKGLKELLILSCDTNFLTNLILPKNIIEIYCRNNKLEVLDVSRCKKLEKIIANNNNLDNLNIIKPLRILILYCDREVKGLSNMDLYNKILLL